MSKFFRSPFQILQTFMTARTNGIGKIHTLKQASTLNKIGPSGWILLAIPVSTFSLGTWQIFRKQWKEKLLSDLTLLTTSDPVELPDSLEEIEKLEYRPVHVKGRFLHEKEFYIGPRSLLCDGNASTQSSLISNKVPTSQGFLVVTPFKLSNKDITILVNRGWVPAKNKSPHKRARGQVDSEVDVIGIVRLQEKRPPFIPKNQVAANNWFYRDVHLMAEIANASPVFIDSTIDFGIEDGPIGGQTRIFLRNEHLSYILTWYTLCGATTYMWLKKFIIK